MSPMALTSLRMVKVTITIKDKATNNREVEDSRTANKSRIIMEATMEATPMEHPTMNRRNNRERSGIQTLMSWLEAGT